MILDCDTCAERGSACGGCPVAVLLDPLPRLQPDERAAIAALADAGVIESPHLAVLSMPERSAAGADSGGSPGDRAGSGEAVERRGAPPAAGGGRRGARGGLRAVS